MRALAPFGLAAAFFAGGTCGHEPQHGEEAPAVSASTSPPAPSATAPPPPGPASAAPDTPACPEGMVWVPPTGPDGFTMGRAERGASDQPHKVVLTRGVCWDRTEVTVRAYAACVDAGACKIPYTGDQFATYPKKLDHPVNMVSWVKARAYCAWVDKRLPTEAEWEWAAAGPEHTKYPWGDTPEPSCGVGLTDFTPLGAPKSSPGGDHGCFGGGPSEVASHAAGKRVWPGGEIYDLAGNVWEWTEDSYAPYEAGDQVDPLVRQETNNHAIRGGGWNRPARAITTYFRGSAIRSYQVPGLGFRCVKGAPHPTPPPFSNAVP